MGSWGYRPDDNDGSWDLYNDAEDAGSEWIEKLFRLSNIKPMYRWERVGVLFIALRKEWGFSPRTIRHAEMDLELLAENQAFIEGWRDSKKVLCAIRQSRKILKALLLAAKRIRSIRRKSRRLHRRARPLKVRLFDMDGGKKRKR